jgi:hypothetical protein
MMLPLNHVDSVGSDLQALFHGKVELFQDDTFLTNGRGQTNLLASASTAVIVVHHNDHCCFQTVPL